MKCIKESTKEKNSLNLCPQNQTKINISFDSILMSYKMDKNKLFDAEENIKLSPSTWHPHVYGKPPNQPTPYSISDILGWKVNDVQHDINQKHEIIASPKSILRDIKEKSWPQLLERSNYKSSMSDVSEDDTSPSLDQPLNLSISKAHNIKEDTSSSSGE